MAPSEVGVVQRAGTGSGHRAEGGAFLLVPATGQTQIPALACHGRCAESRGGNSRHGEHSKFHVSTLA